MVEQAALSFGGLLRQLRAEANLTQEELAEAAQLSPRSVSDLERGISRTARKDTALLLAGALDLAGPVRELFVAAARGRAPAAEVLAAREGRAPGTGHQVAQQAPACPYRGLLPFGESDAGVFYGRERLSAELAAKLAARASRGGLVVVTGASGAGKSSLLRAGLLPIVARGQQVPGSDRWPRIVMTPTKDPLTELATRLAAVGGPDALTVRDGLARHPGQAHLAIRSAVLAAAARRDEEPSGSGDGAARLVLIVDQFEQVFTLNPDTGGEATRQAFITALCAAAATPAGPGQVPPALVVLAVRGDFCDRCAAFPELAGALQDGLFVVVPMTESELRVAITGPAQAAGLRIDPALTETILGDLRVAGGDRSAGVLPLLSQAMALTWEQREGDRLTSHGYAQAGGVSHAVQTGADRAYGALPAGQQAIAREVLRRMTVASRDGGLARCPVTRQDLYAGLPGADRSGIDAVLDAFAAERLAVLDGDTAQLSHDVLLRAWPRLRGWLEEDQASWIVHGQLADAAAAWHDSNDDPSFLYRGAQLTTLQQAVTRWSADPARSPALTSTQRRFLHASERAAARGSRRRRSGFALLALLTVLAVAASGVAATAARNANQQRTVAVSGQLAAESEGLDTEDPVMAALLGAAAWQIAPTAQARVSLLDVLAQPDHGVLPAGGGGTVIPVAFSPDGKILATASLGAARLWDLATGHQIGAPLTAGDVEAVAFSPGGKILATTSGDGTAQLWDLATHHQVGSQLGRPPEGGFGGTGPPTLAFSPDGRTLAATSIDGKARLWDLGTRRQIGAPLPVTAGGLSLLAFSPDGKSLATAAPDGTARLWDLATHHQIGAPLAVGTRKVSAVAFSPDGKTLATTGGDSTTRLWDLATHHQIGAPLPTAGWLSVLAFSPDGKTLATAGLDSNARLWDLATRRQIGAPLPVTGMVVAVAFSPDGKTLATGGGDGNARLWDLANRHQIGAPLAAGTRGVSAVAFSPDGKTLATASLDGRARLWDVGTRRQIGAPLVISPVNPGYPNSHAVAFSPDGKTVATASVDGSAQLWDLAGRRQIGAPLAVGTRKVSAVAFSPDGKTVATFAVFGDKAQLWDLATHQTGAPLAVTGGAQAVAFSPDGRTLATASVYGTAQLRDLATHRQIGAPMTFSRVSGAWNSIAFSPDGRTLATWGSPGVTRLWDVATHAQIGAPLPSGTGGVHAAAFSPDGMTLATAGADGTTRLWDLATHAQIGAPLPSGTGRVQAVAFSPDGKILATASVPGGAQLWDIALPNDILNAACVIAGRSLTRQEWSTYIQSEPFRQVCPQNRRAG